MYPISDIANYFLVHCDNVTPKKLQKLCYYAEAWSQALHGQGLINDAKFEAWVHGPVAPPLYTEFRDHGWNVISRPTDVEFDFSEDTSELLASIVSTYGNFSGNELEALTHSEDPWRKARRGYNEDESCNVEIDNEAMAEYYQSIYIGD